MPKTPEQVIAELEATSSRNGKEAIVAREARAKNDILFEGFRYAFDSLITFGVAKVPAHDGKSNKQLAWSDFKSGLEQLRNRTVTGHAARDLILDLMHDSNPKQWDGWYRRILLKDMKAGFTSNTVNKVVYGDWVKKKWVAGIAPKYRIAVFECQLAKDADGQSSKMTGEKLVENKYDGTRCLTVVYPSGKVEQFSRNGKEMVNFPNIIAQFEKVAKTLSEPTVFDGEMMSANFQSLMKQINRKKDVDTGDANLHIFDWLPLDKFLDGLYLTPQLQRSESLGKWFNQNSVKLPNVRISEFELINLSTKKGLVRLDELRAEAAALNLEGVMLKAAEAPYQCSRTTNWLKIKPVISVDLEITDIEEGKAGKKYAGTLGALVCSGVDQGRRILTNVGSGFSDVQRDDFWKNRKKLIGQIVEIEADVLTLSEGSTNVYSLRFPRFKCFRDDK